MNPNEGHSMRDSLDRTERILGNLVGEFLEFRVEDGKWKKQHERDHAS